jgi:hypothetical protein
VLHRYWIPNPKGTTVPTYAKAIVALVTTALAQLAAILTGTADSLGDLTDGQWITVALAALGSAAAVYGVRNGVDQDPTTSTPDREGGYSVVELLIGLIVGIILLIVLFKLLAYL